MKGYEDVALPFGKYKGKLIADVPNSYLNWLTDQEFVERDFPYLYDMAKMEKEYREEFRITI